MKPPPYFLFVFLLFTLTTIAQQKRPLAGKEPSWTTINRCDYGDTRLDHEAEDGYFDIEFEQQVSLSQQSVFYRRVIKILTEAGIQNSSEVSANYDPSYEQLIFHSIKIIRGNQTINHLNLSRMKTIQQEKELNRHLYNGRLTSLLFLEDVRKGDIIEYSYTLKGFNPIFKGKYAGIFDLNFKVPVGTVYYKLAVPKERQVTIKNFNSDLRPTAQNNANETIYEWKLSQVKAMRVQDNTPGWYDPYSMAMVSEYQSWKEVNAWAMDLFPVVKELSPGLQNKISEIRGQYDSKEQQVAAALRFVQDEIRYLGIEMGENSHRPGNPNKTFSQRFGDCKDKSYLLCTILNALGIEASPVLINSTYGKNLVEHLPSALAFDHATVRVRVNGSQYWFDPTISFQRGQMDAISYPDYQYGLVIHPDTDALTKINRKEKASATIREVFDIPDMSGKAGFFVTTQYTGSFADNERSRFNNTSRYEIQKAYKEFYAAYYENITSDSIQYTDNEATGVFTTREYYTINDLWKLENGVKKASFDPYVIDGNIKRPKDKERNMPFALNWPARYVEEVEINLPEDWTAEESNNTINTSSFSATARFSFDGKRTVNIKYTYENLKDHVVPRLIKEYTNKLDEKDSNFSYVLSYSTNENSSVSAKQPPDKINSDYIYVIFFTLLIVGGIIWWAQRK